METKKAKQEKTPFDLNKHIFRLIQDEPFFSALSRRINKVSSKSVPTAGVWINPATAQFELLYNPDFFEGLPDNQKAGVLKHEFYHIIFEHITSRKPQDKNLLKVWNIATDLAINSYLTDCLPDFCCFPEKGIFAKYPVKKSSEWYFKKLLQDNQNNNDKNGNGDGSGQFDSHDKWEESGDLSKEDSEAIREIAKEKMKENMRKAAQEASQAGGWGSISSEMQQEILERITPQVDWRKVLRYFVRTSRRSHKSSTVRRVNKRYSYIHPGKKVNRTANIAISIDQSGSVGNDMLVVFFSELNKLAEIASFTVIPFDHEVREDKIFEWKKGRKVKTERVSCGGTCFDAPTKYVNDHNFDGHIILTDLCAPKPISSKIQRMWITTKEHALRPYFSTNEKIIAIDKK